MFPRMPMPVEIVGLLRSTVSITWEDEHRTVYPARELRLRCRCASCIEEMTGRQLLDPDKVPENVRAELKFEHVARVDGPAPLERRGEGLLRRVRRPGDAGIESITK